MTSNALVKTKLNENLIKISVEKLLKNAFFDDYPYSFWAYNQVGGYNSALTKILLSLLFTLVNRFLSGYHQKMKTRSRICIIPSRASNSKYCCLIVDMSTTMLLLWGD